MNLPEETLLMLRNQGRFFMELERQYEGESSFEDIISGSMYAVRDLYTVFFHDLASQPVPSSYQVNHFVKTASSSSTTLDMTVVSESAWICNKPSDQEELEAALAKGNIPYFLNRALIESRIENEMRRTKKEKARAVPGDTSDSSFSRSDSSADEELVDNSARDKTGTIIIPILTSKINSYYDVLETLSSWFDPLRLFSGSYWSAFLKKQFVLNKKFDVFDHNKNWIHPSRYKSIFCEGVWVVIDFSLRL